MLPLHRDFVVMFSVWPLYAHLWSSSVSDFNREVSGDLESVASISVYFL